MDWNRSVGILGALALPAATVEPGRGGAGSRSGRRGRGATCAAGLYDTCAPPVKGLAIDVGFEVPPLATT